MGILQRSYINDINGAKTAEEARHLAEAYLRFKLQRRPMNEAPVAYLERKYEALLRDVDDAWRGPVRTARERLESTVAGLAASSPGSSRPSSAQEGGPRASLDAMATDGDEAPLAAAFARGRASLRLQADAGRAAGRGSPARGRMQRMLGRNGQSTDASSPLRPVPAAPGRPAPRPPVPAAPYNTPPPSYSEAISARPSYRDALVGVRRSL